MLRINHARRLCGRFAIIPSSSSPSYQRLFIHTSHTILVDTDGTQREILYTGPVNDLIHRTKVASLVGAGASILMAPLAIHYLGSATWSIASNLFFLSGVMAASLGQFWATSRMLSRYVTRAYHLTSPSLTDSPSDSSPPPLIDRLVELETLDWLGRARRRAWFIRDLYSSGNGEVSTKSTGECFIFCPHIYHSSPILTQIVNK